MEAVSIMPHTLDIWWIAFSQTFITSTIGLALFLVFVIVYNLIKKSNPDNKFVNTVEIVIEWIMNFFEDLAPNLPMYAKVYIMFVFFYIFWNNMIWVFGDLFTGAFPVMHHFFRPTSTDITFNLVLAIVWVVGAIVYGFQHSWFAYIEKYISLRWVGIVPKVKWPITFIFKFFDILIGFFIWLIELIGELSRIASLSLRLFGNILAWMIILGLVLSIPLGLPVLALMMEVWVWFLQAFVFSLLVLVYFRVAGESHH